jgi:branched-chain amino acid transport system substrate-binding protein
VSLFVSDVLEPRLRASGVVRRRENVRVALVRHNDTGSVSFTDVLLRNVRFNGKSATENGGDFRQFVAEGSPASTSVIAALADFRPHVVLAVGAYELARSVFEPLEQAWPRGERFRPLYVMPTDLRGQDLFRFVGKDAARRQRIFGVNLSATTPANAKFTAHYNEAFRAQITLDQSPTTSYDGMYLLAYAGYAAGDGPVTGSALARAIARLVPPGKPIDVGPAPIFEAFGVLRNGENIDLNGAGNALDFDLETGESSADYVIQCIGVDARGEAADGIESGIVYDSTTRSLRGSLRCP